MMNIIKKLFGIRDQLNKDLNELDNICDKARELLFYFDVRLQNNLNKSSCSVSVNKLKELVEFLEGQYKK